MEIIVMTGLAGAGKSTALRALEDIGYFCVDNIPVPLFEDLVKLLDGQYDKLAVVIDARQRKFLTGYSQIVNSIKNAGHEVKVLYLDADTEILQRRYSATRRSHPLSDQDVRVGIEGDREVLDELKQTAAILDTSTLNVHQLRGIIQERFGATEGRLKITLLSFGFKHGIPKEADLVFDVRFLPNPYFEPSLSKQDGRDADVAKYVLESEQGKATLKQLREFLEFSCPHYDEEGKRYLTIAIGCTGGRHRSVAAVEALSTVLGESWDIRVRHRDLSRSADG